MSYEWSLLGATAIVEIRIVAAWWRLATGRALRWLLWLLLLLREMWWSLLVLRHRRSRSLATCWIIVEVHHNLLHHLELMLL